MIGLSDTEESLPNTCRPPKGQGLDMKIGNLHEVRHKLSSDHQNTLTLEHGARAVEGNSAHCSLDVRCTLCRCTGPAIHLADLLQVVLSASSTNLFGLRMYGMTAPHCRVLGKSSVWQKSKNAKSCCASFHYFTDIFRLKIDLLLI